MTDMDEKPKLLQRSSNRWNLERVSAGLQYYGKDAGGEIQHSLEELKKQLCHNIDLYLPVEILRIALPEIRVEHLRKWSLS